MDLDPEILQELYETFSAELEENLHGMTESLLMLEKEVSEEQQQNILNTIFRSAHTIKGGARGLSLESIGDISHHLESLFSRLKQQQLKPDPSTIDLCLQSLDHIRELMSAFIEKREPHVDVPALLAKLNHGGPDIPEVSAKKESLKQDVTSNASPRLAADTARISIDKLNKVSALGDEVQMTYLSLEDLHHEYKNIQKQIEKLSLDSIPFSHISKEVLKFNRAFHQTLGNLSFITGQLQDTARLIRLVPAATVIQPLKRSSRDIAKELNKKIDFEILGDDIEVDRAVLELLHGPLIHLLRNAIDHGIEAPDVRKAQGKNEVGNIRLSVERAGDEILITLKDDGAGIDLDSVRAIGIQKKFITPEEGQSFSEAQILDLLFRPGFSTKAIITDVSGRGVGMDVVKTNIQELKGQISIETKHGKGTAIQLRLPLTLSTEHGVIVKASSQWFALPTNAVQCAMECDVKDIVNIEGGNAVLVGKQPVALYSLSDVLGLQKNPFSLEKISVIVITRAWNSVAFIVDEIMGEREIIVKPLHAPLVNVPNVAGATMTGRGEIIIVLNPQQLLASALHTGTVEQFIQQDDEKVAEAKKILVVDDSITTRTLEENILLMKGYDVTTAVNGQEALDKLKAEPFDLVVTDIEMPVMDGFQLTRTIKTSEAYQDLPVIIVTSLSRDEDKKKGIEAGAVAYIVKNQFETGVLLQVIEQLLGRQYS